MISPKDSPFHVVYFFDYWIYSEWFHIWEVTANKEDFQPDKLVRISDLASKVS